MVVRKLVYLIIAVLILPMAACEPVTIEIPVTGGNTSATSLVNTSWRLVSFGQPGSETQTIEGEELILQFEDGNEASGSGGCNMFGAQYKVASGNRLSIKDVVSTMMACSDEALSEQETQYFDALRSAESFEMAGDILTIHYGDGQGVLTFLRISSKDPSNVHI